MDQLKALGSFIKWVAIVLIGVSLLFIVLHALAKLLLNEVTTINDLLVPSRDRERLTPLPTIGLVATAIITVALATVGYLNAKAQLQQKANKDAIDRASESIKKSVDYLLTHGEEIFRLFNSAIPTLRDEALSICDDFEARLDSTDFATQEPDDSLWELKRRIELADLELQLLRESLLRRLELLAIATNARYLNIGVVNDFMGTLILKSYEQNACEIRRSRLVSPHYYRHLEMLIDDLQAIRRGRYDIPAKTAKRIAAEMADPRLVTILGAEKFKAPPQMPWSREQLHLRLHDEVDLREYRYLIFRRAMLPRFTIRDVSASHGPVERRTLTAVFSKLLRVTKGIYPPCISDRDLRPFIVELDKQGCLRWCAYSGGWGIDPGTVIGHISCVEIFPLHRKSAGKPTNLQRPGMHVDSTYQAFINSLPSSFKSWFFR